MRKKISVIAATLLGAAVLCAAPISLHKDLSLSVDKARAVIGRPLTPGSVAGVPADITGVHIAITIMATAITAATGMATTAITVPMGIMAIGVRT
jgi:hypothetical protein